MDCHSGQNGSSWVARYALIGNKSDTKGLVSIASTLLKRNAVHPGSAVCLRFDSRNHPVMPCHSSNVYLWSLTKLFEAYRIIVACYIWSAIFSCSCAAKPNILLQFWFADILRRLPSSGGPPDIQNKISGTDLLQT